MSEELQEGLAIENVIDDPDTAVKKAFAKVLEFVTNNFYKTDENDFITVNIEKHTKDINFYDTKRIVLAEGLIDAFGALNLPRFLVYYHELAHHLYSQGYFNLLKVWNTIKQGPLTWNPSYEHLLNWIEDFYVEDKILKEHSYLTDVLNCIKKLPPEYDINRIEYAFNFWYINQAATPALNYTDQLAFKAYITQLLALRGTTTSRFGQGILTTVSIKQSTETKFALLIIEFYNWCVAKGIFPADKSLPSLQNPNNHLENIDDGNGNANGDANGDNSSSDGQDQSSSDNKGAYSDHSKQVGKSNIGNYQEVQHIKSPTTVFKDELVQESKLIKKELLDMSQRLQAEETTLDGLFNLTYKDSAIIQPKVIIPNFFNPNRIADQILFREKQHTYMNVAIYRDISGSTTGRIHTIMSAVCEQLFKDISVDITYYLYASGDISIIEVPYIEWEDSNNIPDIYKQNPLFSQLHGGTNSDAIADVITQQLSEKWLNIIITDGDLDQLMRRDNIMELLKNVFVVYVGVNESYIVDGLLGVVVNDLEDLDKINPVLSTINLNR